MRPRLEETVSALKRTLGTDESPVPQIERVDTGWKDAIEVALVLEQGPRWFRYRAGDLMELFPVDDADLPVTAELHERGDWELLSYRPGRRIVAETNEEGVRRIIKGYRRNRSCDAERRYRIAAEIDPRDGFQVPTLLEHDQARAALTFEPIRGDEVRLDAKGAERFFQLGVRLRAFQETRSEAELPVFGSRDELGVLDRWKRQHEGLLGPVSRAWSEIRETLSTVERSLPVPRISLCHRDLHDGQLMAAGGGFALLDFDLLCRGDEALDPANLLAHLSLRARQGIRGATEASVVACGESLLDGLGRSGDESFWIRLRFYQATTLLRLALVYALRPRWARVAPAMTELARLCVTDLEHARKGRG